MTKIDIFSGFLGAGKTTLIKKLIKEAYAGEKLVLIENEFGEIGVDGGFLADAGINVTEMNSGCICCSLVGDFSKALVKVLKEYHPDRILIEPSGVGKLSDVVRAVKGVEGELEISSLVTVVDAGKCKMYMKNFGEFFGDQIANAGAIVLSHTGKLSGEKVDAAVALCRAQNADAVIVTTDWDALTGEQLRDAIEHRDTLEAAKEELAHEHHEHHEHGEHCECGCHHDHHEHHHDEHKHEHHHHEHDEHCECGCHHDHDEHHHDHHEHHHHDEHKHEHHHEHHHEHGEHCHHDHEHHHEHGEHCHHDHEHHHEHDEHCSCGCHDHDHHHHHHDADEVFVSCGAETARFFTAQGIKAALDALTDDTKYGMVLRAKGMVPCEDGKWLHFDLVPGEFEIREGGADYTGRLCVIGAELKEHELEHLFMLH